MCDSKFIDSQTIDRKSALKTHLAQVHDTECFETTEAAMFLESQLHKENVNQNQQQDVYFQDVHRVSEQEILQETVHVTVQEIVPENEQVR